MDLDALLLHYAGSDDPAAIGPDTAERIAIDFGVERDPGRRFALWALLHVLGAAPDPDRAFEKAADRTAARDFTRLMARAGEADDPAG
ncbi:hypothetical protein [Sphingomonas profundi]|uniref:hypothetical protein n=1 Tax=Alterirhizorhabdus profundi TaxID=2681549 RepID=UPI0012E85755|nr:hypothetical protein [Sphingomonas profundi]